MKKAVVLTILLFTMLVANSQRDEIVIKSVKMEKFIPFVATNYLKTSSQNKPNIITVLIPVNQFGMHPESKIILKQGFSLLTGALGPNDKISLVAYNHYNGELLRSVQAKDTKKILYALENLATSIIKPCDDGTEMAFEIADEDFNASANNTLIILRDNAKNMEDISKKNKVNKGEKNTVLLSLIGIAPEMVRLLKD